VGLAVFAVALVVLNDALHEYNYREVVGALRAMPASTLVLALVLTAAGYLVLMGYDLLAFRYIGRAAPLPSVAAASFVANALGNNLGNNLTTGAAVRYWVYTSAGLTASQTTRIVLFCSAGYWLGFLFLAATAFLLRSLHLPAALHVLGSSTRMTGGIFALLLAAYLWLVFRGRGFRWRTRQFELPDPTLTLGQIAIASLDLGLMAGACYVLLPPVPGLDFGHFLAAFLLALVAGTVSQVPGGLGVFESVMVLLLSARIPPVTLASALLMFRGIYLVLPLLVAVAVLAVRGGPAGWLGDRLQRSRRWVRPLAPQVLAGAAFLSGSVLLFSGALPAGAGRLAVLDRWVALPMIEASHFVASLIGAALLLLARGLQRRIDAAWLLTMILLTAGALLSLAKGVDFEEAIVLGIALAALAPCRRQFYRRSALLAEPLGTAWSTSIIIVLGGSAWLLAFAHKHAAYAMQPWWDFALHAEASRSLRAAVGALGLVALFALYRLMRPPRRDAPAPTGADIDRARPIVERSVRTYANLVFRGDKALLFSAAGDGFLMYGRQGNAWIAMGDPVGPESAVHELAWRFRDLCDRYDAHCVFFEVRPERRALYADLGLTLTPLGEEACVDLADFRLDTPARKDLRQGCSRARRAGCRFEILAQSEVASIRTDLARVSDAWLAAKATREKGFSNASFDVRYLMQFPMAVVRRDEAIIAFANVWLGAGHQELSVDLMRHVPDAPNGTMDFLFCELLSWGRDHGYRWFNFGMAPLSGLAAQRDAPVWGRVGAFVHSHGEHFYNFTGLRRYKDKFGPVWTPLYLASPGGLALPAILVNVAALIAGGLAGIVTKGGAAARG
jgi:phosphatidylglycerol lysyltransferase